MRTEVQRYTDGVAPELDPELLVPEAISRCADLREGLVEIWDQLTSEERDLVHQTDQVLIANAARVAPFWAKELAEDREALDIPQAHWWWFLDNVADGSYPRELLPEL